MNVIKALWNNKKIKYMSKAAICLLAACCVGFVCRAQKIALPGVEPRVIMSTQYDHDQLTVLMGRFADDREKSKDEIAYDIASFHKSLTGIEWYDDSVYLRLSDDQRRHVKQSLYWYNRLIKDYPKSPMSPKAMGWVGGLLYRTGHFVEAIAAFQSIPKRWPSYAGKNSFQVSIKWCICHLQQKYGNDLSGLSEKAIDFNSLLVYTPDAFPSKISDFRVLSELAPSSTRTVTVIEYRAGNYMLEGHPVKAAATYELASNLCIRNARQVKYRMLLKAADAWLYANEYDNADKAFVKAVKTAKGLLNTNFLQTIRQMWNTGSRHEAIRVAILFDEQAAHWFQIKQLSQKIGLLKCIHQLYKSDDYRDCDTLSAILDFSATPTQLMELAHRSKHRDIREMAEISLIYRWLRQQKYGKARQGLVAFLKKYPKSSYRSDVMHILTELGMIEYWLPKLALCQSNNIKSLRYGALQSLNLAFKLSRIDIKSGRSSKRRERLELVIKSLCANPEALDEDSLSGAVKKHLLNLVKDIQTSDPTLKIKAASAKARQRLQRNPSISELQERISDAVLDQRFREPKRKELLFPSQSPDQAAIYALILLKVLYQPSDADIRVQARIQAGNWANEASSICTNPIWTSKSDRNYYLESAWWLQSSPGFCSYVTASLPTKLKLDMLNVKPSGALSRRGNVILLLEKSSTTLDIAEQMNNSGAQTKYSRVLFREALNYIHQAAIICTFPDLKEEISSQYELAKSGLQSTQTVSDKALLASIHIREPNTLIKDILSFTERDTEENTGFIDCNAFNKAIKLLNNGNYKGAYSSFKRFIEDYPLSHHYDEAHICLAACCEFTDSLYEAYQQYLLASKQVQDRDLHRMVLDRMMTLAIDLNNQSLTIESSKFIKDDFPGTLLDLRAQLAVADYYMDHKQWKEARSQYIYIRDSFQNISRPYVLVRLARCQAALKQYSDAIALYEYVLNKYPKTTIFIDGKPKRITEVCSKALLNLRVQ